MKPNINWKNAIILIIVIDIIIIWLMLLGGCVHVKLPDGTEYWQLGEARKVGP